MGNVSIVISVAPAIGPTIAGIILNLLSWRWIFIIVLPIALAMLLIGIRRVENVSEPEKVPIDVLSVILSAFGFGGLVYGLTLIGQVGPAPGESPAECSDVGARSASASSRSPSFITRQLLLQRKIAPCSTCGPSGSRSSRSRSC